MFSNGKTHNSSSIFYECYTYGRGNILLIKIYYYLTILTKINYQFNNL